MTTGPPDAARREALRRGERALRRAGYRLVAGADEAGAGPLAGPLVAAAVILPPGARLPGVDDSKRLTARARAGWAEAIAAACVARSVVEVPVEEIDAVGPLEAAIRGMTRAIRALDPAPDFVLTDARRLPEIGLPQEAVIGGDGRHLCIAAASVLAKVHRDALMERLDALHPGYGFAKHKGYGTAEHMAALRRLGPTPVHRASYAPVREAAGLQGRLFERGDAP